MGDKLGDQFGVGKKKENLHFIKNIVNVIIFFA